MILARLRLALDRMLQAVCAFLMLGLAAMVIAAVSLRAAGRSPLWYDEVAAVWLAWLTFVAASLVTLRRAHLGFDGLMRLMRRLSSPLSGAVFAAGEAASLAFYAAVAFYGWRVLGIIGDEALVSLPWLQHRMVQSVVPAAAAVMFLAQVCSMPDAWRRLRADL